MLHQAAPAFALALTLSTASLLAAAQPGDAAPVPPPFTGGDLSLPQPTLFASPATAVQFGRLAVEFERSALADVRTVANNGQIARQSEAADSRRWLCYTVPAAQSTTLSAQRIWLISDGETGGPDHLVTEVQAAQLAEREAAPGPGCPALRESLQRVSLSSGVWLNMSEREVRVLLGPPSASRGSTLDYFHVGKVVHRHGGNTVEMDRGTHLRLHMKQGRVHRISASQITSN